MYSIETVLATRQDELMEDAVEELPEVIRSLLPSIDLTNEGHWIARWVTIKTGSLTESFELRRLDLYELADRYPELELGW
jgi:hypothetical protein